MIYLFDPRFWILVGPCLLLGLFAQMWVKSAYARAQRRPAPLSGAAAARHILDSAGLHNVQIQVVPGRLTDHYDPRRKVLRLSQPVYQSHSLAAVGIAAHEAGHAIQDARAYGPLVIRNLAVPAAGFGSGAAIWLILIGVILAQMGAAISGLFLWLGVGLFACFVFFQLVNLPVEFNASTRAKAQLAQLGIVASAQDMRYVNSVLSAAALTYVAATLQALAQLLYFILIATARRR
jgi:Zn-dependent membrane protease YugP